MSNALSMFQTTQQNFKTSISCADVRSVYNSDFLYPAAYRRKRVASSKLSYRRWERVGTDIKEFIYNKLVLKENWKDYACNQ